MGHMKVPPVTSLQIQALKQHGMHMGCRNVEALLHHDGPVQQRLMQIDPRGKFVSRTLFHGIADVWPVGQ